MGAYTDNETFATYSIGTILAFAFLPKTCAISGKNIWLEYAYRRTAMWTGPGLPLFEDRWYDQKEYIIATLRGEV